MCNKYSKDYSDKVENDTSHSIHTCTKYKNVYWCLSLSRAHTHTHTLFSHTHSFHTHTLPHMHSYTLLTTYKCDNCEPHQCTTCRETFKRLLLLLKMIFPANIKKEWKREREKQPNKPKNHDNTSLILSFCETFIFKTKQSDTSVSFAFMDMV